MKIAFIVPALANKGPVLVVKDLVSGLVKRNVLCKVYYFDDIHEVEMDAPIEKISFRKRIPFNDFDVIHSHGIRPDIYVFFHKPKNCSAHCISTMHNYMNVDLAFQYNALTSFVFSPIWRFFLKKHDTLVVLSNDAKRYYRPWFNKKPIEVVYNSREINLEATENLAFEEDISSLKKRYSTIGVIAALTKTKGIDLLIDALPCLPNHALIIVGDGKEKRNLEQQAKRHGVADRCLFLGYRKNAHHYLKFFDIYCMPSRAEGFPLALLEAAEYKKNTICSNIAVFQELFSNKEVNFFELNNSSSLVNAVLSANNMDKGELFFEACSRKYSMKNFIDSYLKVYNKED